MDSQSVHAGSGGGLTSITTTNVMIIAGGGGGGRGNECSGKETFPYIILITFSDGTKPSTLTQCIIICTFNQQVVLEVRR